jgi:outer membrane protein
MRLPGNLKESVKSMKRMLSLVCVLASGLGVGAFAQAVSAKPVPATGTMRVAVINFQQAVAKTNEFQRDLADLQKKYAPREQALQQLNDQIDTLKKQLQGTGATLTDAERQAKMKEIDDDTKNLQRSAEDLRNDEQSDGQETFQQVGQKVFNTMANYAKAHGFGLVLDASPGQQSSPALWWAPTAEITADVVAAYNASSGIPAPVPSAPAPNPGAKKPGPTQ